MAARCVVLAALFGCEAAEPTIAPRSPSLPGVVHADPFAEIDVGTFARTRAQPSGASLRALRLFGSVGSDDAVRVSLELDAVAAFRRSELPEAGGIPRRVFVDLDGVTPAQGLATSSQVGRAGVAAARVRSLERGVTRVSFDVGADTQYRLFVLTDPYRVILDFRRPSRLTAARPSGPTIVLDPGHGGAQDGARGPNGIEESAVALQIALRARQALRRRLPAARVLMTRERDVTVTLEERAALANAVDADLFVSIHLNASPSAEDRGGVSTYVLDNSDDVAALRLAARENGADERDVTDLQRLLGSLYRKDQVEKSLALASQVQSATLRAGRRFLPELPDRGVKKALFYVLVGATMPAVLCEASFITRSDEAALLATDEYRQSLADGIADGIATYLKRALMSPEAAR